MYFSSSRHETTHAIDTFFFFRFELMSMNDRMKQDRTPGRQTPHHAYMPLRRGKKVKGEREKTR